MHDALLERVRVAAKARTATVAGRIQSLWSGYGEIVRVQLEGARTPTVIVKHVEPPTAARHPRGWNTSFSHERKLQSYRVEMDWYARWSNHCGGPSRVAHTLAAEQTDEGWLFVLEDLDSAGFPRRERDPSAEDMDHCLRWLAHFHATFLGEAPNGLWPVGTYWHLATRPDELNAMGDATLKDAAPKLDHALNTAQFQSLVHGDAKVANFCFPTSAGPVAAVDFQYVGGGCGIKDVAYFLSSCLEEHELEQHADGLLDRYFQHLGEALPTEAPDVAPGDVEHEWRALYPVAWADFYRFLDGWSPGHWKVHGYSRRMTDLALESL